MLTGFIRNQLIVFAVLTLAAIVALGWFYLRIPSQLGIGQYRLIAELPASGGLYRTSNVTYRGIQIGRVTKVEPTAHGVRATLSIDSRYKIPIDASANVHSVSAIGEQYVDLVSTGDPGKFFVPGQTITKGTVPSEIGPALDAANRGLSVLPKHKIASLLNETARSCRRIGPGTATTRRLDPVDRRRFRGQHVRPRQHHRQRRTDSGQPGGLRRLDRAVVTQPQGADRRDRAQRSACAKHPVESGTDRRSGRQCVQRRPRIATADNSEPRSRRATCSSATTKASNSCWYSCPRSVRSHRHWWHPLPDRC